MSDLNSENNMKNDREDGTKKITKTFTKIFTKIFVKAWMTAFVVVCCMLCPAVVALASEGVTDKDIVWILEEDASQNVPFSVRNMFPGDVEKKDFTINVSHTKPISVYYHADIREGYEKLAEVLKVKIELPEKNVLLYDGLMRDMPISLEHKLAADEKKIVYRITAYLDTSVGNDYQAQRLIADFRWWYAKEDGGVLPEVLDPASVKLTAEKILDTKYARGDDFTFILTDENNKTIQTKKNKDGLIEFDSIRFDKEGTYIYYIKEKNGGSSKIEYDSSQYKVTIKVTEGEKQFNAEVSCEKNGTVYKTQPRFANKTISSPATTTTSTKTTTTSTRATTTSTQSSTRVTSSTAIQNQGKNVIFPSNAKTGDNSRIGFYLTICVLSLVVALFLIFILLRRRKKEKE